VRWRTLDAYGDPIKKDQTYWKTFDDQFIKITHRLTRSIKKSKLLPLLRFPTDDSEI